MEHFIKQHSQEPILSVTLYNDEKFFKEPFGDRIENSIITFNMVDEKGAYKILNGECDLIFENGDYSIIYPFTKSDTKKIGEYKGEFKIQFLNDTYRVSTETILPIKEELIVSII
mgnify:FL=1|jgi:hypothetical protein